MALPIVLCIFAAATTFLSLFTRRDAAECPSIDMCGLNFQEEIASPFMVDSACRNIASYRSCFNQHKGNGDCKYLDIEGGLASIEYICADPAIKTQYSNASSCLHENKVNIKTKQDSCTLQGATCDHLQVYMDCLMKAVDDCCGAAACTTNYGIFKASIQPGLDNGNLQCSFQSPQVCGSQGTCS